MDRSLYPANWDEIAFLIKTEADWTCQKCDRKCRKKKEKLSDFIQRVVPQDGSAASQELLQAINKKPGQFVLTVAHLNHIPSDCRPENLRAWCSVCHCLYDLKAMPQKKRMRLERLGQLNLFENLDHTESLNSCCVSTTICSNKPRTI